ncbi:hypothetical protein LSTR_LSTR009384 [Laodelphax striatellus]|uniref:Uncharacterized protein n=1 Tax=Laodelphax striatellus TaxID=195883 RepID=A0A482XLX2_LAOST|nr:hypothetical protein LSTR_LSTR009384 [Laodelphax striatellus]
MQCGALDLNSRVGPWLDLLWCGWKGAMLYKSTTGSNTGATIIPKAQFDENDVVDRLDRIFKKNNEGDPKPLKAAKAYEVIDLLTSISNDQRQKVRDCYDKKHPDKENLKLETDFTLFIKSWQEDSSS